MILAEDFFDILYSTKNDDTIRCRVRLNAEHPIYKVHFPDNPITPGVCLIQMVTELLERHIGRSLAFHTAVNIKFRQPIYPKHEPTFVFTNMVVNDGQFSVRVSIEDGETQFAKMSLIYHIQ